MSCSATADAVIAREKTVTRRAPGTWRNLKPGDRVTIVRKAMGLAKGEKQEVLAEVEIVSNRVERLRDMDAADLYREGCGEMSLGGFFALLGALSKIKPNDKVRRIEWRYLECVPGQPCLELGTECSVHEMYRCETCRRWVSWESGADDELPGSCDDCWAKADARGELDDEAGRVRRRA